MIGFFIVSLIIAWLLAFLSGSTQRYKYVSTFFMILVITVLSLISGLRTAYNDTEKYIYNFIYKVPDTNIFEFILNYKIALGENPGFYLYQFMIKTFISNDPQVFLFITALITNMLFVLFYKKYSASFSLSIYLFITSGLFMLGMGAMKQMLSMSIGIWAIHFVLKKQILKSITVLFLASIIHPFIILYTVVFLVQKEAWSKIMMISLVAFMFLGIIFEQFVTNILTVLSGIGVEYTTSFVLEENAVNTLRLLVFGVTPLLSYIYRKKINATNNKMLIVATNFSIISFMFMLLASHGGANMFGRMANYFEPFMYLTFPWILFYATNKAYRIIIVPAAFAAYGFFFYYQTIVIKLFTYPSIFEAL